MINRRRDHRHDHLLDIRKKRKNPQDEVVHVHGTNSTLFLFIVIQLFLVHILDENIVIIHRPQVIENEIKNIDLVRHLARTSNDEFTSR